MDEGSGDAGHNGRGWRMQLTATSVMADKSDSRGGPVSVGTVDADGSGGASESGETGTGDGSGRGGRGWPPRAWMARRTWATAAEDEDGGEHERGRTQTRMERWQPWRDDCRRRRWPRKTAMAAAREDEDDSIHDREWGAGRRQPRPRARVRATAAASEDSDDGSHDHGQGYERGWQRRRPRKIATAATTTVGKGVGRRRPRKTVNTKGCAEPLRHGRR
uniref:Uncharacterized protein n=1 Tax=Oryza sativa subsp. japonica TaxID=39947 RepID=Q8LI86_ORYSJ|nr:hypothetical protein [Oryza sativa Japonica Group]